MHVSKTYRVSMYRVFLRARRTVERKSLIHVISQDKRMRRYRLGTFVTRFNRDCIVTPRERQMIVKTPFFRCRHRLRRIVHLSRRAISWKKIALRWFTVSDYNPSDEKIIAHIESGGFRLQTKLKGK
jgi:hypothetical protein